LEPLACHWSHWPGGVNLPPSLETLPPNPGPYTLNPNADSLGCGRQVESNQKGIFLGGALPLPNQREFFIDNLLVRIHFIMVLIRWTGLAPWEFELSFPGSVTSTPLPNHTVDHAGFVPLEFEGCYVTVAPPTVLTLIA